MKKYDDFSGGVPQFYEKFIASLPHNTKVNEAFFEAIGNIPDGATIVEIGMGTGSLAKEIFGKFLRISRYIGIEPAVAMTNLIPNFLRADPRLTIINEGFGEWHSNQTKADFVLCRYVVHDLPEQLEDWYSKIAGLLKPGGCFVNLDVTIAEDPVVTQHNLEVIIKFAKAVNCSNKNERRAQKDFIDHLRKEISGYRPLNEHVAILRSLGLDVNITVREGNNYVLKAWKNDPNN